MENCNLLRKSIVEGDKGGKGYTTSKRIDSSFIYK
mgnify:CR=1 FL=1|jgi:hypothetical protein